MAFYWLDDTVLALTLFVFPAAVGAIHIGPAVAVLHERIEPHLRPLASALFLMILTLVGLGLGPLAVGAMSDRCLCPLRDADSLRYALLVWQIVGLWGAAHFYFAGRAAQAGIAIHVVGAEFVAVAERRYAQPAREYPPQRRHRLEPAALGYRLERRLGSLRGGGRRPAGAPRR